MRIFVVLLSLFNSQANVMFTFIFVCCCLLRRRRDWNFFHYVCCWRCILFVVLSLVFDCCVRFGSLTWLLTMITDAMRCFCVVDVLFIVVNFALIFIDFCSSDAMRTVNCWSSRPHSRVSKSKCLFVYCVGFLLSFISRLYLLVSYWLYYIARHFWEILN